MVSFDYLTVVSKAHYKRVNASYARVHMSNHAHVGNQGAHV